MFEKNLKYYRLKMGLTKKELAKQCGLTPMAITNYENGLRNPNVELIKKLAQVLEIKFSDLLDPRNEKTNYKHGEFRKNSKLNETQQDFVRESVEEYFDRFFTALDFMENNALPKSPKTNYLSFSNDIENDALTLRKHLGLPESGPIGNLIALLENKGILIYKCDIDNKNFFGISGMVNDHPYIVLNSAMSTERNRSTIAHELVHLMFKDSNINSDIELLATCIGGAFLLPKEDAKRELGITRHNISNDMIQVCKEYGISFSLLTKRAFQCGIINKSTEKEFYIRINKLGWNKNEPSRIEEENPTVFKQLVFRLIIENEINIQKGVELLKSSYDKIQEEMKV